MTFGSDARTNRGFAVVVFVGAVMVIAASFWLTPDPHGYGTHRQLFLMPCWFRFFTGIPCPFCGMTTAFAHLSRGQVVQALECHLLSPFFYALAWIAAFTGLRGVITGRWPLPLLLTSGRFDRALLVAIIIAWAVNVARVFM